MSIPPTDSHTPLRPTEQLPIALFGGAVLSVRGPDGSIYLSIHDLCDVLGITFPAQRRRILSDEQLSPGMRQFRVRTSRGPSDQDFLELERIPLWMLRIQSRRVDAAVQDRVRYVQEYLRISVYAAFAQLIGLTEQSSRQIEDLAQLDAIDPSLQALAERQAALETSQERARTVWQTLRGDMDALRTRVRELEQALANKLTPAQRRVIYDMVHVWGHARAARDARLTPGTAIHACWALVTMRFRVTSYTDIPAGAYEECLAFIQDSYHALTGERLASSEQKSLEL
ncbi:phage antirepressor N-terminal domain-containing protein [Oscillochloris sp. ZM17-4]|uniref:phage antirepressor N-terminal domain-containing protein n=1 Tax=Oscillochloris sp. ZM17-4 TaxID=2866714 RepID=UPI0021085D8D|nr:phage antirepressor N-terminal domain-containing protein [Oscillochloris sp. ZM17-4]